MVIGNESGSQGQEGRGLKGNIWRVLGWGGAALMLALPLAAMQFSDEVNWTASDFLFAGVLLGSVGLAYEVIVRRTVNSSFRAASAVALGTALLTVMVNGAVGMIGSEDNVYNLAFAAVLAVAAGGAAIARFRPRGMALAMASAAIVQAALSVAGMASDPRGGALSVVFAGFWLIAALLFRMAARRMND